LFFLIILSTSNINNYDLLLFVIKNKNVFL
jgi:hypothetical protein